MRVRWCTAEPPKEMTAMAFQLPDLPFAKDALAPHMSAETLDFHHGKHHKAYVNKTNELLGAKRPGRRLAGRGHPRRAARAATRSCSTTAPRSGTTASSGNAWRRPRASSRRQAREADRGRLRRREALLAEAAGGSGQPLRQRLGLAGPRPRQAGSHLAARRRHAGRPRRHGAACSRSMCGSTPITSTIATSGRRFATSGAANIVNWDFVAQNLDGNGFERADQEARRAVSRDYCLSR